MTEMIGETDTSGVAKPAPGSHIADPAALGLAAFALTTFVLSMVNAGWVPAAVDPVVFGLAFAYGGIAQLGAGIWEFAKDNTFSPTAFWSYARSGISPSPRRSAARVPIPGRVSVSTCWLGAASPST